MAPGTCLSHALLASLLSASQVAAQTPTGTVTGRILDETTTDPISGAAVRVAERTELTNAAGRFLVNGVPVGSHAIQVTRFGYSDTTRMVDVTAGDTIVLDFTMAPQALELTQLVVTGYGTQRASDLTGVIERLTPEELNPGRVVSPEELIQSKVAGVQVIDNNEPGGGMSVRIRGTTSVNASSDPLFVVDGVPLDIGGGLSAGRNPLNFLNPQDIENVTVLKDASATAIYGSRGGGGVVIIETKRGQQGPQIEYTGTVSGSTITREPDMLNADQFRAAVEQFAPQNVQQLEAANTDWRDLVQRDAFGQEHNLAISGGTEAINYRLSLGYLNQDGVIRGTTVERFSAALNYDHRINDYLSIRTNLRGSRIDDAFTPGGVLSGANQFGPTQPMRDPGSPTGFYEWPDPLGPNNPLAELALISDEGTTYRSVGNIQGEYRLPFLEALKATVNAGYDVTRADRRSFFPSTLQNQLEQGLGGTISRQNPSVTNTVLEAYLSYASPIGGLAGTVDVTGGYTYEESRGDFPSFFVQGLSTDLLGPDGVPAADLEEPFLDIQESKLISFFGRLNYALRDRYHATVTVRRDGSSRFGPGNDWGTFPSVAVAWRLSQEPFMERFALLSDLKLRASWGKNGNQAFANYQQFSTYTVGDGQSQAQFGDEFVPTIRPSAVDPNIKWEETTSFNLGLDFGLFESRLTGSIDYYDKDTDDLIFTIPVAAGTNLSNFVTTNIGSMKNQGVEFSLDAGILDGGNGGLRWDASFNAAYNTNELVHINPIAGGAEQILVGNVAGGVGTRIQVLQPGQPINSFFVFRHRRGADGMPIYEDANGDDVINEQDLYEERGGDPELINQDDRVPLHSPDPDWILGHTSRIAFRNLDLSFTMRAYLGNYVYNNVASNLGSYEEVGRGSPFNLHASVLETGFETPQYFSDYYVEDASFLRMDNLTLGYTLQWRGLPMRIFGTVQSVFTLTGYSGVDPTAGVSGIDNNIYPRSRTFSGGVAVRF